jgi:DNA-binding NarL/FixJ family response regulator
MPNAGENGTVQTSVAERPAGVDVVDIAAVADGRVRVAILSGDPLTADGVAAHLRSRNEVRLLPHGKHQGADITLVLTTDVTEETLGWMQTVHEQSSNAAMRIVLVATSLREQHLTRAIGYGLASVLPRHETGYEKIVRAVVDTHRGRPHMPERVVGWLVEQNRAVQRDVLAPRGLTAAGLETREVDVLKLLADGMDTGEIAATLNYSERTIKNVLHGLMSRLELRNRSHAVAYALRAGAL